MPNNLLHLVFIFLLALALRLTRIIVDTIFHIGPASEFDYVQLRVDVSVFAFFWCTGDTKMPLIVSSSYANCKYASSDNCSGNSGVITIVYDKKNEFYSDYCLVFPSLATKQPRLFGTYCFSADCWILLIFYILFWDTLQDKSWERYLSPYIS